MASRFCTRCEQPLPFEASGALLFCPFCGAPQVSLSEQVREEITERHLGVSPANAETAPPPSTGVARDALLTAAIAGAGAGTLALGALALPPVGLLLWLWVVGAPVIALGLYSARRHTPAPGAGFGARLGFLSGLAVMLTLAFVNTVALLLTRFVFHKTALVDAQLAAVFTQVRTATEAQYGAAAAAPFAAMIGVPEFRAGLLLSSIAMFCLAYLVLATLGGAFAGVLRGRPTQTPTQS